MHAVTQPTGTASAPPNQSAESAGAWAVLCDRVSKVFPVFSAGLSWRVIFGLSRASQGVQALREVSLSVPKGQFSAVLGRNGSGKSTLLRVLGGVYEPDGGRRRVVGEISALFELGGALGNPLLTGREYASRWLEIYGVARSKQGPMLQEILEFSELGEAFEQPIRTYSSGMAARLYFATATSKRHEVFLIDELLTVGDEHFQAKCWARIREVLSAGVSGVLVTHDWSQAMKICRTGQVLEKGRTVHSGRTEAVVRQYLGFKLPPKSMARFLPTVERTYSAIAGEDAKFELEAEVLNRRPVAFAFAIEVHHIGIGWEIVMLGNDFPVGEAPGRYRIALTVPKLPVTAGDYLLTVSLAEVRAVNATSVEVFDERSWTLGNSLQLEVRGPASRAVANLPFRWKAQARPDQCHPA